jgi:hypothetical protein
MVRAEWLRRYQKPLDRYLRIVLSCDPAGKACPKNDYTATTIVGVTQRELHLLPLSWAPLHAHIHVVRCCGRAHHREQPLACRNAKVVEVFCKAGCRLSTRCRPSIHRPPVDALRVPAEMPIACTSRRTSSITMNSPCRRMRATAFAERTAVLRSSESCLI